MSLGSLARNEAGDISYRERPVDCGGLTNLGLEDRATSPFAMEAKHFHDDILVEVEIRRGEFCRRGSSSCG